MSDRLYEYFSSIVEGKDIRTCLAAITIFQTKVALALDEIHPVDKVMDKMIEALIEARNQTKGWKSE
jgi:hypothetical protein